MNKCKLFSGIFALCAMPKTYHCAVNPKYALRSIHASKYIFLWLCASHIFVILLFSAGV
jgi:hypothetical protein